jgi:hypothetical protein
MECTKCGVTLCEKNLIREHYSKKIRTICKQCKTNVRSCSYKYTTDILTILSRKKAREIANIIYHNKSSTKKQQLSYRIKFSKRNRKNRTMLLTDGYISTLLNSNFGLLYNEITPELIEVKRNQIILKRCLKQINS